MTMRRPAPPVSEDQVLRLAASVLPLRVENAVDVRHLEWRASEVRGSLTSDEIRDLEDRASAFANRICQRIAIQRSSVHTVRERPHVDFGVPTASHSAPLLDAAVAAGIGRNLWDADSDARVRLPGTIPPGRYVALAVAGDSMDPVLHSGDTILVQIGGEFGTDAVIVARQDDDSYVVKRVGRVSPTQIELLSVNPEYRTVFVPNDRDHVLGSVLMRWCTH